MAEEWGTVVIRAPADITGMLKNGEDAREAVKHLADAGQVSKEEIEELNCTISESETKGSYTLFGFHCSDWKVISELFVREATNLEYYSRVNDEYGTTDFYLLNGDNERYHFSFDQGGDLCEIEGYEDEVREKIARWISMIPDDLTQHFPEFIDTDNIEFDGP